MSKKTVKKSNKSKKPVSECKQGSENPLILSYQKFVLEITRGLDKPYLTTGFVVTSNKSPDEYIVIDPTPYSPFLSQEEMHKAASYLYCGVKDLPLPENAISVPVPKAFSLNYSSSGILKTRMCGMLFGHLLCPILISHKRSPFSSETNDVATMVLNTKVHFGDDKGRILLHSEKSFPLVGMYCLENLSPLNGGELVVSTGTTEPLMEYKPASISDFSFIDASSSSDIELLTFIASVIKRSDKMSNNINEISSDLFQLRAEMKMREDSQQKGTEK